MTSRPGWQNCEAKLTDKVCVALVCHTLQPDIIMILERIRREAPNGHEVFLLFNSDAAPDLEGLDPAVSGLVVAVATSDLLGGGYPEKCKAEAWDIAGNLDLAFLEFWRRRPGFDRYWFIEYDVHYEGDWRTFLDYFARSDADVLGAILFHTRDKPHKLAILTYPPLVVPASLRWEAGNVVKGFFPLCRLSATALRLMDSEYRAGLGGHYEVLMPSLAVMHGLKVEDIGGRGAFVRPANRDRFYFATPGTFTHSPGTFVFRPAITRVLPHKNTLWHPVKPSGTPAWFPLKARGNPVKNMLEWLKPHVWQGAVRLWFATRWNPLP